MGGKKGTDHVFRVLSKRGLSPFIPEKALRDEVHHQEQSLE